MISLVAQTINWCVSCVLSVFSIAAYIGQTIVNVIAGVLSFLSGLCAFFATVYEENRNLFALEVPSMVLEAPFVVLTHFSEAAEVIGDAVSIGYKVIVEPITDFVSFVFYNIGYSAESIKKLFIIIGDSIWLILTFIPIQVPLLINCVCAWIMRSIGQVAVAAYSSLLRLTDFLTDVPLQSTVGMVVAVVMVRLIVDFKVEIASLLIRAYWWTMSRLRLHYYTIYNYFTDDETRIIDQIFRDRRARPMNADLLREGAEGEEDGDERGEALCVVCQERQKCVLILPCRHICLCCECCVRLYSYQRTCPICRTFICHSVNVYF